MHERRAHARRPRGVWTRDELRDCFVRARELQLLDMEAVEASYARVEWRPSLAMLREVMDEFSEALITSPDRLSAPRTIVSMAVIADVRIPLRPLTVERYERMVDAGILDEDDRVELLNGQLTEKIVQGPEHSGLLPWLADGAHPRDRSGRRRRAHTDATAPCSTVRCPNRISRSSPRASMHIAHPCEAALVIEVSRVLAPARPQCEGRDLRGGGRHRVLGRRYPGADCSCPHLAVAIRLRSCREIATGLLRPPVAGAPAIDVAGLFALLD